MMDANEARAIWDALTKPRQEILEAIKGDTDRGVIHAYFAPHVHWLESLGLIIDGNTRDQVITSKGRSVYAAGQANATPADERDSPAEIMGMWPTEPGHTFIRGLWRVSEKTIGELRTEEYELLSENPDELDALRAENARLREALGDVLRFVQINEPDNTYADLVVNLDMDGWQTGTRSKLGTDDLGHALKRAADALGSDAGEGS